MNKATLRPEITIGVSVLLIGLLFATYTHHAWEDYWITFRASRNLATGQGLVFTSGERLQTFTSPLGVLLPAAFSWVTGNRSDDAALWLFREVSAGALAAGMVLLFRALRAMQLRRVSCWLTVALIGLDAKTVDFAINGMETGLLVFFLALAIHGLVVAGPRQTVRLGMAWAGLMWTRPDSCVYIAILGVGALFLLRDKTSGEAWTKRSRRLLGAGLVCTVVYLPWFLWAWRYYGSPIPHTIIAKATNLPPLSFLKLTGHLVLFPLRLFIPVDSSLHFTFLPAYWGYGGWSRWLMAVNYVLGLPAALAWLMPGMRQQTRFFSLACFLGSFFLTEVVQSYFPWYLPTVAVFGYLTIGLLLDQTLGWASGEGPSAQARSWSRQLSRMLRAAAVGLVLGQAALTVCVARQMQVQQQIIETGLRLQIGLWLRDHARSPQDTVMLEPLGYIGYFSGLRMVDWPGLVSTEMVAVRKRLGPSKESQVGLELKPDWIVWRPAEAAVAPRELNDCYTLVRVFDVSDKIKAVRWLPGNGYLWWDRTFLIFHRQPDSSRPG